MLIAPETVVSGRNMPKIEALEKESFQRVMTH
jgi:hypothetical protein